MKIGAVKKLLAFLTLCCACLLVITLQDFLQEEPQKRPTQRDSSSAKEASSNEAASTRRKLIVGDSEKRRKVGNKSKIEIKSSGVALQQLKLFRAHLRLSEQVIDKLSDRNDHTKLVDELIYRRTNSSSSSRRHPSSMSQVRGRRLRRPRARLSKLSKVSFPFGGEEEDGGRAARTLLDCNWPQPNEMKATHWPSSNANFSQQQQQRVDKLATARPQRTLLIVVNSKWSNYERRQRLRNGWLNTKRIKRSQLCALLRDFRRPIGRIEYVFALGKSHPSSASAANGSKASQGHETLNQIQSQTSNNNKHHELYETKLRTQIDDISRGGIYQNILEDEFRLNRDMLVLNLYEHYQAMSLKHLSIFKWILKIQRYAQKDTLLLKCDDDAQVNLIQLLEFQDKHEPERGKEEKVDDNVDRDKQKTSFSHYNANAPAKDMDKRQQHWIMCAQFPANSLVLRQPDRKWQLSRSEYEFDTFPAYCSGLAYLAPKELIKRLLVVAEITLWDEIAGKFRTPLWVDDVFVTGILFASMAEPPQVVRMNAHFCYTRAQQAELGSCIVTEASN